MATIDNLNQCQESHWRLELKFPLAEISIVADIGIPIRVAKNQIFLP